LNIGGETVGIAVPQYPVPEASGHQRVRHSSRSRCCEAV